MTVPLAARVMGPLWAVVAVAAAGAERPADTNPVSAVRPDSSADTRSGVWSDRVIVKLRRGIDPSVVVDRREPRLAAIGAQFGITAITPTLLERPLDAAGAAKHGLDRFYTVWAPAGSDAPALAAGLASLADLFELAETDPLGTLHTAPSDALFPQQWALHNSGQSGGTPGADIRWLDAWQIPFTPATITVALLDTGVSLSHPDLAGQLVPGRCYVCGAAADNTDDSVTLSHGTLCAGILGALTNNRAGVAGVAPQARIMPVKVTTGLIASQTYSGNGLIWAVDHGARIASMSWGFSATANVSFLRSAVEYASDHGVLMVASTGNTPGALIGYPARWTEVIAVGATDNRDAAFTGMTTGPEMDLVAPGVDILTTVDQTDNPDGYTLATGTSMAAPMVAAVAAVVWSAKPALAASEVRDLLERTAHDLGPAGWDPTFGFGRVDLFRALLATVPAGPGCVADVNGDGAVDLSDLFQFLQDYFAELGSTGPGLHADIDRNGAVSTEDIFAFMAAWFAGC